MLDLDVVLEPDDEPMALDRSSARSFDVDGRLLVRDCKISKANVCQYVGSEIPRGAELGVSPSKIYRMYRDRAALKAAAASFEGIPLLIEHQAVNAADPKKQLVVGSVGPVRYEHPYLIADYLKVWDAQAIALIESGAQRDLSCGYHYRAVMTPGTVDGESFDGRMIDIVGNHLAIVAEGRVGPDVTVNDGKPAKSMADAIPHFNRLGRGGLW